jgi:hypothetical protein
MITDVSTLKNMLVMLHTEIVHTLRGIFDRHDVCPCGMCDQKALRILRAARHALTKN